MSVLEQQTLFTIAGCCTVILHSVCCLVVIVGAQWLNLNSHAELQVFFSTWTVTCKRAHILLSLISSYIVLPNWKNKLTNQLDLVRSRGIMSSGRIRTKLEFKSPMSCVYSSKIWWLDLGCFLGGDFNWQTPASHWVSLFYNPLFCLCQEGCMDVLEYLQLVVHLICVAASGVVVTQGWTEGWMILGPRYYNTTIWLVIFTYFERLTVLTESGVKRDTYILLKTQNSRFDRCSSCTIIPKHSDELSTSADVSAKSCITLNICIYRLSVRLPDVRVTHGISVS